MYISLFNNITLCGIPYLRILPYYSFVHNGNVDLKWFYSTKKENSKMALELFGLDSMALHIIIITDVLAYVI